MPKKESSGGGGGGNRESRASEECRLGPCAGNYHLWLTRLQQLPAICAPNGIIHLPFQISLPPCRVMRTARIARWDESKRRVNPWVSWGLRGGYERDKRWSFCGLRSHVFVSIHSQATLLHPWLMKRSYRIFPLGVSLSPTFLTVLRLVLQASFYFSQRGCALILEQAVISHFAPQPHVRKNSWQLSSRVLRSPSWANAETPYDSLFYFGADADVLWRLSTTHNISR